MSQAVEFTVEERAALLRAVRREMDSINEAVIRLQVIDGRDGNGGEDSRRAANVHTKELLNLATAVRKIWIGSAT